MLLTNWIALTELFLLNKIALTETFLTNWIAFTETFLTNGKTKKTKIIDIDEKSILKLIKKHLYGLFLAVGHAFSFFFSVILQSKAFTHYG